MVIRLSTFGLDEMFCAAQGYGGAYLVNAIQGAVVINSVNAAICLGGIALTEKLFSMVTDQVIPGSKAMLGPIPIGTKNIVSYGLAIYTTVKVMQVFGLILSVPTAITIIGIVSAIAVAAGCIYTLMYGKPLEEQLAEHAASTVFAVKDFDFKHEEQTYTVRIICNPERGFINFNVGTRETPWMRGSTCPYTIASNGKLPSNIKDQINKFFNNYYLVSDEVNNRLPLDYTTEPFRYSNGVFVSTVSGSVITLPTVQL